MSLNNLSLLLAEAGRRDEGLATIRDAVRVPAAGRNLAAYEPDLVLSLSNLSRPRPARQDEAEHARREAQDLGNRGHVR